MRAGGRGRLCWPGAVAGSGGRAGLGFDGADAGTARGGAGAGGLRNRRPSAAYYPKSIF